MVGQVTIPPPILDPEIQARENPLWSHAHVHTPTPTPTRDRRDRMIFDPNSLSDKENGSGGGHGQMRCLSVFGDQNNVPPSTHVGWKQLGDVLCIVLTHIRSKLFVVGVGSTGVSSHLKKRSSSLGPPGSGRGSSYLKRLPPPPLLAGISPGSPGCEMSS